MASIEFNEGWRVRRPLGPFAEFGGETAEPTPVTLPHDAMRDTIRAADVPGRGAGAYYPPSAFTYVKTFDAPEQWTGRLLKLEFGGAMRHAQVFVNEEFAGNRADGYARFFIDATPFVQPGTNTVRVEVRTGQDSRWYSGAGLHRGVRLHVLEPVHILPDGLRVTTVRVEDDHAVVEVAVSVHNAGLNTTTVSVQTEVADPDGNQVEADASPLTVPPGTTQLLRHRLYIPQPRLWSPDHPHLYTTTVDLGTGDPVTARFGIRSIAVDPRHGLRLNGEPVLLRGACIHHDNGPLGAVAIPRAEERRVQLLKDAGFNAIRSAHNPASEALLDACDRYGMLVMDEAFDMWVRFKTPYDYAMEFPQWWREDLTSMVAKDFNHPSVIMYSLGNEISEVSRPHGAVLTRAMAEHIRHLDPTRLVTNGVSMALAALDELGDPAAGVNELLAGDLDEVNNRLSISESVTRRTAESSSVLDVLGLNYADSRYRPDAELFPHRVIVGSETFGSRIGHLWPMVEDLDHVIGDFTWTGWDYLGEVGIGATSYAEDGNETAFLEREYPFLTAQCGDLDITGYRRPVSYYREIVYGLRDQPYIAVRRPEHQDHTITLQSPWAWSDSVSSWTWPGHEGQAVTIEVYAAADEVALMLNGEQITRSDVGALKPRMAVMEATYQPGRLEAVAYLNGVETGRHTLETATEPTHLEVTADRTAIRASMSDLAFVSIELRDDAGQLVPNSDRVVTVEVSGPGHLAGLCSANPKTVERFDASSWTSFDGRLLAVVQPHGQGTILIKATADGMPPGTTTVQAGGEEPDSRPSRPPTGADT